MVVLLFNIENDFSAIFDQLNSSLQEEEEERKKKHWLQNFEQQVIDIHTLILSFFFHFFHNLTITFEITHICSQSFQLSATSKTTDEKQKTCERLTDGWMELHQTDHKLH